MNAHSRLILIAGAILAGLGVAFGAFGSHALETLVSNQRLETWQTAVRYQLIHALALLAIGAIQLHTLEQKLTGPAYCLALGSIVFSGSLYALVLLDMSILGALTPIGGLGQLTGWTWFTFILWRWRPTR
ncbi:hypothetical protein BGP77_09940 [Saccharospirillum sp. MSK14-1]|uniref:DUF423 domain-containing protein n=1 Tax=Saccharospirillum sp. MSK14-1 TaxID=1897632 RepID=UPI000D37484F|nr:DUF423 domain-containing protein [Saccharospirillum sp. MSK14-1]PTY39059.1 hypothetical protein BGP77_09940 [Saccharospirillum sp. MSK14-1]